MLKICLVFWESEPQYAYKRYAYKKTNMYQSKCAANLFKRCYFWYGTGDKLLLFFESIIC